MSIYIVHYHTVPLMRSVHWCLLTYFTYNITANIRTKFGRAPAALNFADDTAAIYILWLGHEPAMGSKMAADCLCQMQNLISFLGVGSDY